MPRPTQTPAINKAFALDALANHQIRLDGRKPLDQRPWSINFYAQPEDDDEAGESAGDSGTASAGLGKVDVRLGKTRVIANISASIVKPREDRPYEGLIYITSEMSGMTNQSYIEGRTTEDEVLTTRLIEKAIRKSEAVDRESLCILAGEKVWAIRITLHYLSDDGNLLDCACMAAMAALRHFKKEEVEVRGDEITVVSTSSAMSDDYLARIEFSSCSLRFGNLQHKASERAPMQLAIHHTPLCVTFAYLDDNNLILDPSHYESSIATGCLTLTLNAQRELCVLSKAGGTPLAKDELMRVVRLAVERVRDMTKALEDALKADEKIRIIEVR
ncbi:hypothetical protein QFC22_003070 [Naganishia vaughanmartiniae]|uniref:Uncharacterized protein n=1 Tax=Naganishia vaughanmartiniae TaxID=1424756 RepID=A0ACC2X965_9TREE|nr:hypothetical protein QFC22_003070 [Naganishia vaughanmartiniae]